MNTNARDQAQSLREMVERNATPRRAIKIATVASGKGGVGKSSLCVNIAIALSALGYRVLVVDADFGLANIDVMLGVSAKYNMGHLIRGERTIAEIIQEGHNGVRFISGGSGVFELLQMDENSLRLIMRDLIGLNDPADVILFDAGAGINDHLLQLIEASTETIIITTPEPTSILDAYALVKTIVGDVGQRNLRLIMNKCESRKEAQTAVEGFAQVIRRHLRLEIKPLGYVLYDRDVVNSIKSQTPVMISDPGGATSKNILDITRTLMDIPIDENFGAKRIVKLFERLLGSL
ncbi:MAG: MinD/ParA family protein [Clostridiales bacterium]|nr:MinD/ParA family protein [Clostridiales bacterium]